MKSWVLVHPLVAAVVVTAVTACSSQPPQGSGGSTTDTTTSTTTDTTTSTTTSTTTDTTITVTVSPASASITTNGTVTFSAAVTGTTNTAVIWTVQEGASGGDVTDAGVYTAPAQAGTFHVMATSLADGTKSGKATVTVSAGPPQNYIQPDPISGDVIVAIDSHTTSPISPYVFGVNGKYSMEQAGAQPWAQGTWSPRVPLSRIGGNTLSSIDWRTGYTNYAQDWCYWNNDVYADTDLTYGGPTVAGSSFKRWAEPSFKDDTAILWTVPLLPYVAGDDRHPATCGDTSVPRAEMALDWHNPYRVVATNDYQLDFVPADVTRVRNWVGKNPEGATATPVMTGDGYGDDFIKWLSVSYPGQSTAKNKRIMVALDNEPDNWSWDFAAKHGWALGWSADTPNPGSFTVKVGHDYLIDRTIEFATAIKDVDPNIDVLGGVFMGYWGLYSFGNMAQPGGHPGHGVDSKFMSWPSGRPQPGVTFPFLEMWLDRLNATSETHGKPIVDVLDTHYYHAAMTIDGRDSAGNAADSDANMLHARMQGPRAFWDPAYHSNTEIEWKDGQWGMNASTTGIEDGGVPMNWIHRLEDTLKKYPHGPQKLAFTEYFLGRAGDISGAIAQADLLGVFAREGVYAATMWPLSSPNDPGYGTMAKAYAGYSAAFKVWVDYDGAGAGHGDTYAQTAVQDSNRPADPNRPGNAQSQTLERITAYATMDAGNPGRMVIIATNKTLSDALNVGFQVTHTVAFKKASVYLVTGDNGQQASITGPTKQPDLPITATNAFNVTLPAQSITVVALSP